jgi:hypothetical protein
MSHVSDSEQIQSHPRKSRNALSVTGAGVAVGLITGAALGVLWWALAPRVSVVVSDEGLRTDGFQPQEYLASDIAFGALALVAGMFVTVGLIYMRREHLVATLGAAILASAVGTAAMWLVGTQLGSVDLETVDLPEPSVIEGPLEIHMPAIFLVWPLTAAVIVSALSLSDFIVNWRQSDPKSERE